MFSFIIINYNTAKLTIACLESIIKYCPTKEFEIILVDNNSSVSDLALFKDRFNGNIRIIANDKNWGFARANNQGAKFAQGDYLFFLNSDTIISQNILEPLRENLIRDSEVGIVAPRLILKNGKEQSYAYGLNKKTDEIAWVSGAALAIRKKIFEKIGGWDEKFFMYFEDVDLCRRVTDEGHKITRNLKTEITHLVGGSPIPYYRRKLFYYRSKIIFFFKYYLK